VVLDWLRWRLGLVRSEVIVVGVGGLWVRLDLVGLGGWWVRLALVLVGVPHGSRIKPTVLARHNFLAHDRVCRWSGFHGSMKSFRGLVLILRVVHPAINGYADLAMLGDKIGFSEDDRRVRVTLVEEAPLWGLVPALTPLLVSQRQMHSLLLRGFTALLS
jgi:hypothetical protein